MEAIDNLPLWLVFSLVLTLHALVPLAVWLVLFVVSALALIGVGYYWCLRSAQGTSVTFLKLFDAKIKKSLEGHKNGI